MGTDNSGNYFRVYKPTLVFFGSGLKALPEAIFGNFLVETQNFTGL